MNLLKVKLDGMSIIEKYQGQFYDFPILACDTETVQGKPVTIQFYDGVGEPVLFYVNEKNICNVFLDYVARNYKKNLSVWFFFCQFDLPIIFVPSRDCFCSDSHTVRYDDFTFHFVTHKTWFGDFFYNNQRGFIRDAYQYVFRGLGKACKDLELPVGKLEQPDFLGERNPRTKAEKKYFERYAKQDVISLWHLVNWIKSLHRKYDVGLSVSLADLCGKIFRKNMNDVILPVQGDVGVAALCSYHGGKTECYIDTPSLVHNVYEYDIKSAYPYAMATIPNFFNYEVEHNKNLRRGIVDEGLYLVNGEITGKYKPFYQHDFTFSKQVKDTWITGYELNSALRHNAFHGNIDDSYIVKSNGGQNYLRQYCVDFFRLKDQAKVEKNKTEYHWYKIALNALYGKFISRIPEFSEFGKYYRLGVLFNPLIATFITGKVRALIHDLENLTQAIHTSTDSIITRCNHAERYCKGIDYGLGSLGREHEGSVLIVRKKLYLFFEKLKWNCQHTFTKENECSLCGGKLVKSALHGFYGNVNQILKMYEERRKTYVIKRMLRLKEVRRSRDPDLIPFSFVKARKTLHVDWDNMREYK